jgi:hypothetical protein
LGQAREPVQRMIDLLKHYFSPDKAEEGMSLAIASDQEGARLTHTHERQVRERKWARHVGCTRWCAHVYCAYWTIEGIDEPPCMCTLCV